jgi:hypothetical protein
MRLSDIYQQKSGGVVRVGATVYYEDSQKDPFHLFMETLGPFHESFLPDPNAFF